MSTGPASVTVIVPCTGDRRSMRASIESALEQGGVEVDVVVVVDEQSPARLVRWCAALTDDRVRINPVAEDGLCGACNREAAEARGEFVVFLRPGDELAPEFSRTLISELRGRGASDDASHAYAQSSALRGAELVERRWPEWDPGLVLLMDPHPSPALVKRGHFHAVGGFGEGSSLDHGLWDLWLKFVERGWRGARVDQRLSVSRERAAGGRGESGVEFARLVRGHGELYARHAHELIGRMNLLLREHNMNWLDESGVPINYLALERQRETYEAMPAVRADRVLRRILGALPAPLARAARGVCRSVNRLVPRPGVHLRTNA